MATKKRRATGEAAKTKYRTWIKGAHRERPPVRQAPAPRPAPRVRAASARRNPLSTYSGHVPTVFDQHINLAGREDWLIVPVSRNRDSGLLDQSNFDMALQSLGGESDTVEVHRFGHWGPGWYEIIIVDPNDVKATKEADEIAAALADYPVLSDEDFSRREYEATISNIQQVLGSVTREHDIEFEENQLEALPEQLFGWFWSNNQSAVESRDDQGGYPSDEEMVEALQGLGVWPEEGEAPEVPEHERQAERERHGQLRLRGVREAGSGKSLAMNEIKGRALTSHDGTFRLVHSIPNQQWWILFGKNIATASILSRHRTYSDARREWDRIHRVTE